MSTKNALKNVLSRDECERLNKLREIIKAGLTEFVAVGSALKEIRDNSLWRASSATFMEFVKREFALEKSHAYRLMEAAEVKNSPIGDMIANEAQARAIAQVPEEDRKAVLKEAKKSEDGITAKTIAAAAEVASPSEPEPKEKPEPSFVSNDIEEEKDKTGFPIPTALQKSYEHAHFAAKAVLQKITDLRSALKTATDNTEAKDNDIVWSAVNASALEANLSNAYTNLKRIEPYAVCTSCQGRAKSSCKLCRKRGFIDKFTWDNHVTPEVKELRKKGISKK